jgi:chromosome segregation ATPase
MNERQGVSSPDPAQATPLRLVAAERVDRIQREAAAAAAIDLRYDTGTRTNDTTTVVTSAGRVEALHGAVVALAGKIHDLSSQMATFADLLTGRHLDYSDQVRRFSLTAEQSLIEHRQALAERDSTVERLSDAVGQISGDLSGILDQVMAALRQSRDVTARNEVLSEQLVSGFAHASQQLAEQGQELRDELTRIGSTRTVPGSTTGVETMRTEMHGALDQLREDIGTDLSGLRRLLSRDRAEGTPNGDLDALRVDITSEMEALVHELHDDQVLMMREILAGQNEIKKLREEIGQSGVSAAPRDPGSTSAQLENEMSRLLIELRALRRRPFLDARTADGDSPAAAPKPAPPAPARRPRARLAPTARSQWAGRPMQGKNGSAR